MEKLKLFIYILQQSYSAPPNVYIGDSLINIKTEVRDLGAIVDENLSLKSHVNLICKTAYIALRNIGSIRKYLDQSTAERLVHAFVTSRLDYCNSLLISYMGFHNVRLRNYNMYKTQPLNCVKVKQKRVYYSHFERTSLAAYTKPYPI